MKPIKLTIVGLNSFKSEQVIDFEQLSDLGMFGIFGNTGSGKSSILDAMTLALFGTVIRADNHKQSIINQSETNMRVSFTFALGVGGQRRLYRAERAYKTKDHVSVNSVRSLLTDITEGEDRAVVIAERERDVTAYIERLLGMKAEDFTRAVVLPQGSFADFLKMKPSDRRAMLERLFSLEKYGNKLSAKVNARLNDANLRLSRLEGEQRGLGPASADNIKAAEQEKAAAYERERQAVVLLEQAQKNYDQASRIYSLQEELAVKQTELVKHRSKAGMINALRQEFQRAEDAAKVKPLLEERQRTDEEVQAARSRYQALAAELLQLEHLETAYLSVLNGAKTARTEQQPGLIARQTKLQDAAVLENEVAGLADKARQSECSIKAAEQQLEAAAAAIRQINTSLETITREISELEQTAAAAKVQPEYRAMVQETVRRADSLERELKALETCSRQHKERQQMYSATLARKSGAEQSAAAVAASLAALADAEKQARQNCPGDESKLVQQEISLAELKNKVKDLTDKAARLDRERRETAEIENHLNDARIKQMTARAAREGAQAAVQQLTEQLTALLLSDRQVMAAKLATGLTPGHPCPVCGAAEHPCPAATAASSQATDKHKEDIEAAIAAAKQTVQTREAEWQQAESKALNLKARLEAAQKGVRAFAEQLAEELAALAETWQLTDNKASLTYLSDLVQAESSKLLDAKNRLAIWHSERESADRYQKNLEQRRSDAASEIAGLQAALASAAAELARTRTDATELNERISAAASGLSCLLAKLGHQPQADLVANLKTVAEIKTDVQLRDHKAEEVQARIGQKRAKQQQGQQRLEPPRQIEQQLTVILAQMRSDLSADFRQLAEKQAQLRSIAQGVPVHVLMEQVKSQLDALRQAEQSAQEQFDNNQAALNNAKFKLTAGKTHMTNLTERLQQIQDNLTKKLVELSFSSESDVQAACREIAALDGMRQQVTCYAEEDLLLSSQCEQLFDKLASQSISQAEWEGVSQRLTDSKLVKEQAAERRIVADQFYSDIAGRHQRWQELENQLLTVREEQQHLTTLQSLLRGSALIEFMAQEEMDVVVRHASDRLKQLTCNRYGLELASDGAFIIRDDDNAGAKRPVNTLSGGETFQTSLALALALSTQIQLKGEHPLEFFFLDEGFGTLDQKLLETVMTSLERLPLERMTIGLISHVETLKQRLLRRLIVEAAEPNGKGTQVRIEIA